MKVKDTIYYKAVFKGVRLGSSKDEEKAYSHLAAYKPYQDYLKNGGKQLHPL